MVTLKQLSEELGISVSTVSKALNNSYEINKKTRERVKKLAEKYNYKPNKFARSLRKRETKTIGVIIPNILNYFFAKVLLAIEEEANKNGYQIIICLSNNKYQKELESLELLSDGSVDGIILSMAKETEKLQEISHYRKIIDGGCPITMFDRVSNKINDCNKVIIDDKKATYEATKFLFTSNRKQIALVTALKNVGIGNLRIEGYKQAVLDYSNASNPIVVNIHNKSEYMQSITSLLKGNSAIDGILTTDNTGAATVLKVAKELGILVPENLSIIGFSDNKTSRLVNPSLTVIDQNPIEIGKRAITSLINSIKYKKSYTTEVINTDLIKRESIMYY